MPAAMRKTCRKALSSTWPRWRSGIRSDIAMYSRLADENASTKGRIPGTTATVANATRAPAIPEMPETTLRSRAPPRL
jgi:hypothetical protein